MVAKNTLKGLFWAAISVPCLAILVLGSLIYFLYTTSGQQYVIQAISKSIGKRTNSTVEVIGFEGDIASKFKIQDIKIYNENYAWLVVENIEIKWSIRDLLFSNIIIKDIEIGRVMLSGLPIMKDKVNEKRKSFSMKNLNFPVNIEHFSIPNIAIAKGVIAEELYDASAVGNLDLIKGNASVKIKSNTGPKTQLNLVMRRIEDAIDLNLSWNEAPNGIFTKLIGFDSNDSDSSVEAQGSLKLENNSYHIKISESSAILAGSQFKLNGEFEILNKMSRINVLAFDLDIDDGQIEGNGCYENAKFNLKANVTNLPIDFFKIAKFPVRHGRLNGSFETFGSIENPTAKVALTLEGVSELEHNVKSFPANIDLKASLEKKKLILDLNFVSQAESLGSISVETSWPNFPVNFNKTPLSGIVKFNFELNSIMPLLPYPDHQAKGHVEGDLILGGLYTMPKFEGHISIEEGDYSYLTRDIKIEKVFLNALFSDTGKIEVSNFHARAGTGEIDGKGIYSKTHQSISLNLKDIPTKVLSLGELPIKESIINGKLDFDGNIDKPNLILDMSLTGLYAYNEFNDKDPMRVSLSSTIKDNIIEAKVNIYSEDELVSDMSLTSNWSRIIDLSDKKTQLAKMSINAELSSLASVFKLQNQKISGPLIGNVTLSGDLFSPDLNGTISLKDGRYVYDKSGVTLSNINLKATANSKKIDILELSASDDESGRVMLNGYVEWINKIPYISLSGDLEKMHLINTQQLSGDLEGKISLIGDLDKLLFAGNLSLTPLDIDFEKGKMSEIPEIKTISKSEYQKKSLQRPISQRKIGLNLIIEAPRRIFISGNGLEAELAGKLKITGSTRKPVLEGALRTIRGQYEFLNKKFKITAGKVWIERNTTTLDITATTKASDLIATINLRGPTDDIQFIMSSVPSLPQDEIIARILFGRDIKKLSPFQAIQLANALSNLSGKGDKSVDLGLMAKTKKLLQVDSLNVDTNDKAEVTVGVGKYLTDDTYLELQQGATTQQTQAVVEVELTPSISLETTTSTADTSVGDIKIIWRHDY